MFILCLVSNVIEIYVLGNDSTDLLNDTNATEQIPDTDRKANLDPRIVGGQLADHGQFYGIVKSFSYNFKKIISFFVTIMTSVWE